MERVRVIEEVYTIVAADIVKQFNLPANSRVEFFGDDYDGRGDMTSGYIRVTSRQQIDEGDEEKEQE